MGNWMKEVAFNYIINEDRTRQLGKTTVLAEACKKIGGIFLTATADQARMYRQKFRVEAYHMGTRLLGDTRPIIFDHLALQWLLRDLTSDFSKHKRYDEKINLYIVLEQIKKKNKKILKRDGENEKTNL